MKKFESDIDNCYYLPACHVGIFCFLILFKIITFNWWFLLACIPYFIIWYVILSYADNSINVSETFFSISKSNLLFQESELIQKDEIEFIELKYNWIDGIFPSSRFLFYITFPLVMILPYILPAFYKLIIVHYKDGHYKRFYCFGIEEDYYTNSESDTFENLVRTFYKLDYEIKMTNRIKDTVRYIQGSH